MTTEKENPLAKDINGDPVAIPAEAVAWRVRRRSGKQGRPQSVFDPETGTPLEIELDSGIDELRPSGPGGYRLDAIDGSGKLIAGVTAYVEVPAEEVEVVAPQAPSETVVALRELTQLLRESMTANTRAMEAMASAFGPVKPASHPHSPEPIVVAPSGPTGEQAKDLGTKILEALPAVAQMVPMFIQVFNMAVAQMRAAANPMGGDSTPPAQA